VRGRGFEIPDDDAYMTRARAARPWAALLVAAALSLSLLHAESGTIEKTRCKASRG